MTVRLGGHRGLPRVDRAWLRSRARRMLRALDQAGAELSIALVDDAAIRALNAQHRGIDAATDVLSFSLLDGAHANRRGDLLGDVVVSLETAQRQARRGRRRLEDEVLRLLIHGTLHLLGHDHECEAEARVMRAEERRLWREVNA
jgi:probable rRNA maturation factor